MKKNTVSTTLGALAALSATAHAAGVISWNYDSSGTIGGGGTAEVFGDHGTGGAGDFAGVVDAEWWGNSWDGAGQNFNPTDLADNDGVASTLDLTSVVPFGTFSDGGQPGLDSDGKWNRALLNGYINGSAGASAVSITLAEIPAEFQASGWDLYVYFLSDNDTRVGNVSDGSTTFYFGIDTIDDPVGFVQATDTTSAGYAVDASYAVFSGNGDTVTITTNIYQDSSEAVPDGGGIAGFQLVQVPEPSIALLGGLGVLGLLRRRRI